jgi:Peptidase family M28
MSAAPNDFSAARAMAHVVALTREPRPIASPGHAKARTYIMAELEKLGLKPEVQQAVSAFRFQGAEGFGAAKVQNVIVRIKGVRSQRALLLNAHYDGGNTGPAAGHCGACVAALLETTRAILSGPPLRHDVILVFSDGEEMGDHGAHAFATQHPWMGDVALAVNYEAMGTDGPATLYVTSPNNAALVNALAKALPAGFGNSVVTELFNAIPDMHNACDLQDYLDYGVPGLGFVLHGQTQNYHTRLDDVAHLNSGSLQSFGNSALAMARAFDRLGPQGIQASGDATFFPLAPFGTINYPARWSLPLAVIAFGLAAGLSLMAVYRRRVRALPVALCALGLVGAASVSTGLAVAVWAALRAVNPNLQVFLIGGFATAWYVAGLSALVIFVTASVVAFLHRKFAGEALLTGAIAVLATIGLALAIVLPGMSYVATLPTLLALPVLVCILTLQDTAIWAWSALLPAMAISALTALLVFPSGMLVAFAIRLEAMSGLPLLALPGLITALATGFVLAVSTKWLPDITPQIWTRLSVALALVAAAALGIGSARSGFDAQHPRPEAVRYELDADKRVAKWVTNDPRPGGWTGQYIPSRTLRLPDGVTTGGPPTYVAQAPLYDLAAPKALLIGDEILGARRAMRMSIVSPRRAPIIEVKVHAGSAITAAAIGGQSLDLSDFAPAATGDLVFYASALAADGFGLDLALAADTPIHIELADMSDGLPGPLRARPTNTMATPGATWDGTIVRSRSEF